MKSDERDISDSNKEGLRLEINKKFLWPFRCMMLLFAWPQLPRLIDALQTGELTNAKGFSYAYDGNTYGFVIHIILWSMLVLVPLWFATFGVKAKKSGQ